MQCQVNPFSALKISFLINIHEIVFGYMISEVFNIDNIFTDNEDVNMKLYLAQGYYNRVLIENQIDYPRNILQN